MSALKSAAAGDTIQLAAGNYGEISLNGFKFSGEVTITSADPANAANVTYIGLSNVQNLTFKDIDVSVRPGVCGIYVSGCTNVKFDEMDLHGNLNDTPWDDGSGIALRNSANVSITNSEFHDLAGGISHRNIQGLTISKNDFHDIRVDGVTGSASNDVLITKNVFQDFFPKPSDHRDAIQFYTTNTTESQKNITITDNVFIRGDGQVAQGIFLGNELGIAYQNVTITGNAIMGAAYNGIYVSMANGATVSNNLVVGYKDMTSWIEIKNSTSSVMTNNTASAYINLNNTGLVSSGNVTVPTVNIGDNSLLTTWSTSSTSDLLKLVPGSSLVASSTTVEQTAAAVVEGPKADPLTVTGSSGADSLVGDSGDDMLDGKAGVDTMSGGGGHDTYRVDDANDVIVESANGGIDTVYSSAKVYSLGANVENLVLTGTYQSGGGNDLDNRLVGNSGTSSLLGRGGNDTLVSTGGDDVMWGGAGRDVFTWDKLPRGDTQITDFARGYDQLDLGGLLPNYTGTDPVADKYVKFVTDGANTKLFVDVDGAAGPAGFIHVATIEKVTGAFNLGSDWVF